MIVEKIITISKQDILEHFISAVEKTTTAETIKIKKEAVFKIELTEDNDLKQIQIIL